MMSKTRAKKAIEDMLEEMYQKAEPKASWYELSEKWRGTGHQFFKDHYLHNSICDEIYQRHKKKLPKRYKIDIAWTYLNFAPTGNKEDVKN